MRKIYLNKLYLAKKATTTTMSLFALLGLIGTFFSLSDLLPSDMAIFTKLTIAVVIVCVVWMLSFVLHCVIFCKKKRIKVFDIGNNHAVYVQYGDIFSKDEVFDSESKRNIVIPVNRCFDTIVDDRLISKKTLHGITFEKIYADGNYDTEKLNQAIQADLVQRQGIEAEKIESRNKGAGNLLRYPVGTVAEISSAEDAEFFLLGLSSFDKNLTAETSDEEYVLAIIRLINYCYKNSQGYPVVMPLIGAGLSKTQKEERDILEYLVKTLRLHKSLLQFDVHIVVRDSGKETIAITGL